MFQIDVATRREFMTRGLGLVGVGSVGFYGSGKIGFGKLQGLAIHCGMGACAKNVDRFHNIYFMA